MDIDGVDPAVGLAHGETFILDGGSTVTRIGKKALWTGFPSRELRT